MAATRSIPVPVVGGELYAEVTGPNITDSERVVLLLADLASNAVSWHLVTSRLPAWVSTIAVDLRGRGQSAELPGPFGLAAHVQDLSTALSHLGVSAPPLGQTMRVSVAGHGFGAFVARSLLRAEPHRLGRYLDIDGEVAGGFDADRRAKLQAELDAAIDRIERRYATRLDAVAAQRSQSWQPGRSITLLEAMVDHELRGAVPEVRFATNREAILADGQELLADRGSEPGGDGAFAPVERLRAGGPSAWSNHENRGADGGTVVVVPGLDHDDLLHHPQGADAVARSIVRMLTSEQAAPSRPS